MVSKAPGDESKSEDLIECFHTRRCATTQCSAFLLFASTLHFTDWKRLGLSLGHLGCLAWIFLNCSLNTLSIFLLIILLIVLLIVLLIEYTDICCYWYVCIVFQRSLIWKAFFKLVLRGRLITELNHWAFVLYNLFRSLFKVSGIWMSAGSLLYWSDTLFVRSEFIGKFNLVSSTLIHTS